MTQHSVCSPVSETEFFLWLEPAVEAMCLWKTFVSSQFFIITMIVANIPHVSPSPESPLVSRSSTQISTTFSFKVFNSDWSTDFSNRPDEAENRVACRTLRSIHFQTRRLDQFHSNRTEPREKIQTGVCIKWKCRILRATNLQMTKSARN